MSFTGLAEVCQNEPCLSIDNRPFQEIASSFKLRLLVDRTTYNFSGKKFALQFSHKEHNIAFFPAKMFFSILSGKDCAVRILSSKERSVAFGNYRGQGLKISFSSPKKLKISSLTGGGWFRFLFALESIQNGCAMGEYAMCFILVIP